MSNLKISKYVIKEYEIIIFKYSKVSYQIIQESQINSILIVKKQVI